ncbi:hypothetical protein PC129_g21980 [Phytophthora cactorum]|nr:hypothetical protein Pcac1_g24007 [Phytophthora cactorum]KAG3097304.1 hypothetical protein PI125_g15732 [Phytophthora idaei]KAG2799920.1 hypothetical protein PC111_g20199 [Phytophthora cactorum]KAG2812418.1 hypothetical protein PC112_g15180 [Phytophthora cactorum]KAG2845899.1 hypothetical protein PC113_g18093 [Phytophthora cactorum]
MNKLAFIIAFAMLVAVAVRGMRLEAPRANNVVTPAKCCL